LFFPRLNLALDHVKQRMDVWHGQTGEPFQPDLVAAEKFGLEMLPLL